MIGVSLDDLRLIDELQLRYVDALDRKSMKAWARTFAAVKHLDSIGLRYVNPRGVDRTELHFAYFGREDDDEEMTRHRVRQSSNLLGPCGMVSMEDAAMFQRLHIGSRTPGMAVFQKGVKDEYAMPREFSQNDEAVNILSWEYYRQVMGFEKEAA